jgi:dipeptidyl aminopeptidase/acylaminoacyl peptidase
VTSELVVRALVRIDEVAVADGAVWWSEVRPEEGGRTQLVRWTERGGAEDLLAEDANARTAVHEYGGGAWWVQAGSLWYTDWRDQCLYRRTPDGEVRPVTPDSDPPRSVRWADGCVTPGGDVMAVVRERHPAGATSADVVNEIVLLPVDGGDPQVVVSGPDFVSDPRWSPDGALLSWLEWDHPDMPWDATRLRVTGRGQGQPASEATVVAGGPGESVFQPRWAADGSLWFASDRTGWWNLYRWTPEAGAEPVVEMDAEIGRPQWVFGQSCYAFLDDGSVVFVYRRDGRDHVGLRRPDGTTQELGLDYTQCDSVQGTGEGFVMVAGSPTQEPTVVRVRLAADAVGSVEVLRPPRDLGVGTGWWSAPEHVSFPTSGGRTAHALFYPPRNPGCAGPDEERPPLLVFIHGGPTGSVRPVLRLELQYWTSRGFAVVDVDYGGSAGHGRAYREQLRGQWGVVDVDDCVAAARWLAAQGRVDADRLCIRGGSAGGFTTLAALAFHDVFAAGASHFGVADLEALAQETHKFESRYLDSLVGPYPQRRDLYVERSPIHHVDSFDRPLAVFQGLEDKVVPPAQSEMIVEALRAKDVPVAYLPFGGEQHGFRRAGNVRRALDGELSFYAQVFGFALPPDERIDPLPVHNLA